MNTDFLNEKQLQVLEFVKTAHCEQKRKYTRKDYWTHPLAVASILNDNKGSFDDSFEFIYEVALLHDVVEDTDKHFDDIEEFLVSVGYTDKDSNYITQCVNLLTDIYTSENFPELNREQRKKRENQRISSADSMTKTVKCADFMENLYSIVINDPKFGKLYIREMNECLQTMTIGFEPNYKMFFLAFKKLYIFREVPGKYKIW